MDELDLGATLRGFTPGQKAFGRYTLKKMLGRGGMGVVWLAQDDELGRDIALKFLPEMVASDRAAVDDLKREVRRAIDLAHPHIVKTQNFETDGRLAAVSMEYVAGDTLSALRVDQPGRVFSAAQLDTWIGQLCQALDYAHRIGEVVHRDLKPVNLMVNARGDLKVLDFGIAASLSESVTRVSRQAGSSGTPVYMSPQQMLGEQPAVTDDIYALGATLYELLTGKPPFYTGNIIRQVEVKLAPSLAERRKELAVEAADPVPPAWESTIAACLAKDPKDRPQSAGEVAERLGLAPSPNVQRSTSNAERSTGEKAAGRANRPDEPRAQPQTPDPKSKTPLFVGLATVVILLTGAGYYFGVHAPEQKRLTEIARLEAQAQAEKNAQEQARRESDALKFKNEQELAVAAAKAEQERLAAERLAAARGGLIIRTTPSGAEVRVGAIALEKSPLTLKDQKLGKYPVRVRLDGYEDWNGEVEVKENDFSDLDVTLIRSTGTLALVSDPAGLEVTVVGAVALNGPSPAPQNVRTPNQLKLPTGRYDLTFRRAGWPEQKQTIEVTRNQSLTATTEFPGGGLELTSTPAGAEVWQNGRRVGVTPYQLADTIPGRYDFELKLKGYQPATAGLAVAAGQSARENIALEKYSGPEIGQVWLIPGLNLTMQPIAPGTFQMGSANGEEHERPVTRVTLSQAFWLGKTEVTQREWQAVMGSNPSHFKGDDRPVENVSWQEAMDFCRKLTERERAAGRLPEGYTYTLPTEAQWEYACRSGTTGDYAGSLKAMGWYAANSGNSTRPVGLKQANAWGLADMHGNVFEWCADWYGPYPGGSVSDPTGVTSGSGRVSRGGSWFGFENTCRSAHRHASLVDRGKYCGLRLALTPINSNSTSSIPKTVMPEVAKAKEGQAWTIPGLNLTLQPIAPGTFQMGSTNGEPDEKPVTRVTLSQAFWLGKTEVTQREWQAVMGNNPSLFKGDERPVEHVSWTEAMEFCRKLTEQERAAGRLPGGYVYTLPTEARWEYACRSGTTGDYAGSLDSMGWYSANSGTTTHPVGQKQANAWGLADMHGNVMEMCLDSLGKYIGGSVTDPMGATSGSFRVDRGGSWGDGARNCRSANRNGFELDRRTGNLGFRLALAPSR